MKTIALFSSKGGVGRTTLAYHLAWMFSQRGVRVLVADLDPQANLTSMFLEDDQLQDLWEDTRGSTISSALRPLVERTADVADARIEHVCKNLGLLSGSLALSRFEDLLSESWGKCLVGEEGAFRVVTALHRLIARAAKDFDAELVLIDVAPNLGAINRSAMLAADQIVVPVTPDLFSLQAMKNLGASLHAWRHEWQERLAHAYGLGDRLDLPAGLMRPGGYVVMQYSTLTGRHAHLRSMGAMPSVYREAMLMETVEHEPEADNDPNRLALLRHYQSLLPMAMAAHKPMFLLKPSDGAIGAHMQAVQDCFRDFHDLAKRLADLCGIEFE
jgi:chromosome partitioning protein